MNFDIVGEITEVETIAVSGSIRMLPGWRRRFGQARWSERKGVAAVRLADGTLRRAEIHGFEAHGIGRRLMSIKRFLDERPMSDQHHVPWQFAICIKTDDADLLTPRRIYQVLPEEFLQAMLARDAARKRPM